VQPIQPPPAQPSPTPQAENTLYDRAQNELPGDLYVLYRIVERIARANGLDGSPWRVQIVPTYDNDAFAAQPNLVAVHRGLLDQLAGDSSAIACIVGREMGHSVKQHIALGEEQRAAQQAQLAEQFNQRLQATSQEMANRANSAARTRGVVGTLGGFLGLLGPIGAIGGSVLGGVGGAITQGAADDPADAIEQQMTEYYDQVAQLDARLTAAAQQQEKEADEAGYLYATQAGFEPQGCLRAMAVLERIPGAEPDPDQPGMPDRITAMQQLMNESPATTLVANGNANLAATQPLFYDDLSRDGTSLRVSSRSGGASDIDRVLGNQQSPIQ
jgi:predicted Zn-dependent protease